MGTMRSGGPKTQHVSSTLDPFLDLPTDLENTPLAFSPSCFAHHYVGSCHT